MAAITTLFSWARLSSWQIGPLPPQTFLDIFYLFFCSSPWLFLQNQQSGSQLHSNSSLACAPFAIPHSPAPKREGEKKSLLGHYVAWGHHRFGFLGSHILARSVIMLQKPFGRDCPLKVSGQTLSHQDKLEYKDQTSWTASWQLPTTIQISLTIVRVQRNNSD